MQVIPHAGTRIVLVLNVNRLFIPKRADPQQVPCLIYCFTERNSCHGYTALREGAGSDAQRIEMWKIRYLFLGAPQLLIDSVLPGANKYPDCFSCLDLGSSPSFPVSAPPHAARPEQSWPPCHLPGAQGQLIPAWSTGLKGKYASDVLPVLWEIKAQPCLQDPKLYCKFI